MSFDLEVVIVNQEDPVQIPFKSSIEVMNERDNQEIRRFGTTWKFMSQTKGIWYSLVKDDEGIKNAFLLCDSDFERDAQHLPVPFWIENEDVIYNLTPLIIRPQFKMDFERILSFFIEQSPSKTIMFLARYQGGDCEIIQGNLSIHDFINQLNLKNILFNVSYLITE
ncbi:hypothetical protein C7121_18145 [Paenibacillus glucanolyticus]|jgi:hypothetical protein|uniref:hypothetical protein n=1 Tax=Paenibacillus TaxID=44249 RepID=UPI0003E22B42|nr:MULTISPECIES: hypothetical protein [Paenibacillus]ANA83007.1 hypothetical protein A3958_24865 [Paenibacillus glucanolyticus]AVV57905.1 hypothetical protein C7121_18145 [Paenibacillus glucanolyticus]ETT34699.1 hypothetical protein C169_20114 [Paenibacillus sp. FSL R5-808]OMF83376.1 hypothetical protein BK142_01730 [Paenibacillus glucanolyticus]